jgi:hypothetical protein
MDELKLGNKELKKLRKRNARKIDRTENEDRRKFMRTY